MPIWPGNPPAFSTPTFDENMWRQYLSSRGLSYRPYNAAGLATQKSFEAWQKYATNWYETGGGKATTPYPQTGYQIGQDMPWQRPSGGQQPVTTPIVPGSVQPISEAPTTYYQSQYDQYVQEMKAMGKRPLTYNLWVQGGRPSGLPLAPISEETYKSQYNQYVQDRLAQGLSPLSFDAWKAGLLQKPKGIYEGAPPSWLSFEQSKQWASLPETMKQSLWKTYGEPTGEWQQGKGLESQLAIWAPITKPPVLPMPGRSRWGFAYPATELERMFTPSPAEMGGQTEAQRDQEMARRRALYRPWYQTPEEVYEARKPKTPYEGWTLGGKAWGEVA